MQQLIYNPKTNGKCNSKENGRQLTALRKCLSIRMILDMTELRAFLTRNSPFSPPGVSAKSVTISIPLALGGNSILRLSFASPPSSEARSTFRTLALCLASTTKTLANWPGGYLE